MPIPMTTLAPRDDESDDLEARFRRFVRDDDPSSVDVPLATLREWRQEFVRLHERLCDLSEDLHSFVWAIEKFDPARQRELEWIRAQPGPFWSVEYDDEPVDRRNGRPPEAVA